MKKLLALLLALSLLLSLAGCAEPFQSLLSDNQAAQETLNSGQIAATEQTTLPQTTEATELIVPPETEPEHSLPPQTDPIYQPDPDRDLPPQTDPRPTSPSQTDPSEDTQTPQITPPETQPQLPPQTDPPETQPAETEPEFALDPNGSYTTKEDVALYLHLYGRLPGNFITKKQAKSQYGWSGGSLSKYGKCIGGDRFYNNEGLLPSGYTYYECDIGTLYSSSRGAKRLVYTYSGIIYYTSDHYKSFTRLY